MANKYAKEKKAHDALLEMIKKHFMEDEEEILDEEMMDEEDDDLEEMAPMKRNMSLRRSRINAPMDEYDDEYDDEYEDMEEEDEEEDMMEDEKLPKSKRKDLAIVVLAKKAGRKK